MQQKPTQKACMGDLIFYRLQMIYSIRLYYFKKWSLKLDMADPLIPSNDQKSRPRLLEKVLEIRQRIRMLSKVGIIPVRISHLIHNFQYKLL